MNESRNSSCENLVDQIQTPTLIQPDDHPINNQRTTRPALKRCFRPKYRIRSFSSKGAFLVLIWNLLVSTSFSSLDNLSRFFELEDELFVSVAPYVVWLFSSLLSGWLADAHLGQYKMSKIGIVLLLISCVSQCILVISASLISGKPPQVLLIVLVTATECVGYAGAGVVLVTLLQVGLDQMPDASATNITSFIAWFIVSVFAGLWFGDASDAIGSDCISREFSIGWTLFPVVCMSVVLCSDFLLSPKWLTIEPKSPQSLKTIFKVLKFAAKHKAPVQRSALTYWEEDIPSRIDLGKSRYGGPFTTEQVEDTKTLVKILVLSVPVWMSMTSYYMYVGSVELLNIKPVFTENGTNCSSSVVEYFTYHWEWWATVMVLIYELIIYPFVGIKTPSSLRRIGAVAFVIMFANIAWFVLSVVHFEGIALSSWIAYIHSIGVALLILVLLTSAIEFMCAQSPYNMRGLLIGYLWCISSFASATAIILDTIFEEPCLEVCVVVYSVLGTGLSVVGFVVYCVLARWYKRRVRDDTYNPQRVVEDVYDRYFPSEPTR